MHNVEKQGVPRAGTSHTWGLSPGDAITQDLEAVRLLGGGSAYEAWLAFDQVTWAPVVVKVLRPDQVHVPAARRALVREVQALADVNHPGVVRCLRHDVDGARPHLVLEQVDGPRLSSLVRRHGPLTEQQYLPLGIDLASALHYLGRIGYVHLDVKPSNVIMGAPARLIDLSVARPVAEAAALRQPVGTDAWMAPEQCDPVRLGGPTPASDVWALGATLHYAVTGSGAFPAASKRERFGQLHAAPAPMPQRVPVEVREVVSACLEPRPSDRPTLAQVSTALEPVLARQPEARLTYKVR